MSLVFHNRLERINRLTIALIVMSFIVIMMIPVSFADNDDKLYMKEADYICTGSQDSMTAVFASDIYKNVITDSNFGAEDSVHSAGPGGGTVTTFSGNFAKLATIYQTLKALGFLWAMAIAMARLLTNIEKGIEPMEAVGKCLLEIGLVGLFIINLDTILDTISALGSYFITELGGESAPSMNSGITKEELVEQVFGKTEGNAFFTILASVMLLIPTFVTWLTTMVMQFIFYQILIEIAVRKAFTPFAVADIYQEGLRSPGARYLKKIFAAYLKLAIGALIVNIMAGFIGSAVESMRTVMAAAGRSGFTIGFASIGVILVMQFTAIGAIFKCGEWCNDIVGA